MTDREFDNLTQVVTYDEWIVSTDNNGKYYVMQDYGRMINLCVVLFLQTLKMLSL